MAYNENLDRVRINLLRAGYTPPEYDQFARDMADDKNLERVRQTLINEGYTPPEFEQFKADMGFGSSAMASPSTPTTPTAPTAQAGGGSGGGMPLSQMPADVVERQVHTARKTQPKPAAQPKKNKNAISPARFRMGMQMAGVNPNNPADNRVSRMVNPATGAKRRMTNAMKMDNGQRATIGVKDNGQVGVVETPKLTSYKPEIIVSQISSETGGQMGDAAVQQVRQQMPEHYAWLQNRMGDDTDPYIMKLAFFNAYGNDPDGFVGTIMAKYDPDNAVAQVWQQAEEAATKEFKQHLAERNRPSISNFMRELADASNVTGGLGAENVDGGIAAFTAHMKYHDLQRMADNAWNRLGTDKQKAVIGEIQRAIKGFYPTATDDELWDKAATMARQQSDQRMFEYAVAKNVPQSATEYFFRKAALGTSFGKLMEAAARTQAGTRGDMEARDVAEEQYEKSGHKVAGIAGTVVGFAIDPLTMASAGMGSGAVKGSMWLGGRLFGQAAMRKFGTTLTGRIVGGAIGGSANLGTFMAASEAIDQARLGGYRDPLTGKIVDYNAGAIAERGIHGAVMGAATGVVSPLIGNVSDKLVMSTESTAGKLAIRGTELVAGTVAEGTIFSIPEWMDGQRDAMDIWTDNMAMMAGFKVQHLFKSAPRRIAELSSRDNPQDMSGRNQNRRGFESRLRQMLDGRPELALTADERAELQRGGYSDLNEFVDGAQQFIKASGQRKELARQLNEASQQLNRAKSQFEQARREVNNNQPEQGREQARIKFGQASNNLEKAQQRYDNLKAESESVDAEFAELPYSRFAELMGDGRISEAARAKMYYYLTGQQLPMSTVMGSKVSENVGENGEVTGYTVQSFGVNGVITSRTFGTKKQADAEANRINRQAELNAIDIGERYYDSNYDAARMYEACKEVANTLGVPVNKLYELMKRNPDSMNDVELQWSKRVLDAYDGLGSTFVQKNGNYRVEDGDGKPVYIQGEDKRMYNSSVLRSEVGEEFGVDVDNAIRKEPNRRSEQEQKAVEEYLNRLYADMQRKQAEAAAGGDSPSGPGAPPSDDQIAGLLDVGDEAPIDPMLPTFKRGYDAGVQERRDIAIEASGAGNVEAQEAWNGVVQRINDDADYMAAQERERAKQMQHKDGTFRKATLKEQNDNGTDKEVYIVDGNVQMLPDGTMVDPEHSDKSVVVYDLATGERVMIDPTADTGILSVGEVKSAEEFDAGIEQMRQQYIQQQLDEAQGIVRVEPGQQITLPTGEDGLVIAVSGDGEDIAVQLGDGTQASVSRADLQQAADDAALADYNQRHGIVMEEEPMAPEAPQEQEGVIDGAPLEFTSGMELTVLDEDNMEKPAMVMGRVRYEDGQFVPDDNGNIVEFLMDGEVKHEHADKLADMVVNYTPLQEETPVMEPGEPTKEEVAEGTETVTPPVVEQPPVIPVKVEGDVDIATDSLEKIPGQVYYSEKTDAQGYKKIKLVRVGVNSKGKPVIIGSKTGGVFLDIPLNELVHDEDYESLVGDSVVQGYRLQEVRISPNGQFAGTLNVKFNDGNLNGAIVRFKVNPMDHISGDQLLQIEKDALENANSPVAENVMQPVEEPQADAMPMLGDGEADWLATTPERGHQYLYNEAGFSEKEADQIVENTIKSTQKALEKLKNKVPQPGDASQLNKYRAEKDAYDAKLAAAQRAVEYWQGVKAVQDGIVADMVRRQAEERAAQDAAARQAAIEAEEQYKAEQAAKQQEQAERGPGVVGQNIIDKWSAAPKIVGRADVKTLADGSTVSGHYVMHEAGATTPSHDPFNGWAPSDGFPTNEAGGTANQRDYQGDKNAQMVTMAIGGQFDGRAYQDPPVVSMEGIDYSGNGRDIAGQIAARNNTDGTYLETLRNYPEKYGFTADDAAQFQHPRVSFVLDNLLPYTPEVFGLFNAQDTKGMSNTETAVALGKTVDDVTFGDVVGIINGFDTMAKFYEDKAAPTEAISMLLRGGVITPMQHAQMFDGDKVSAQGKEMLENLLLGKAFESNPNAIRQLMDMPSVRQQVVAALAEIANNSRLGKYSLEDLLSQAIDLVYKARNAKDKVKQGDSVLTYAKQLNLFPDMSGGITVADINNTAMVMIADILNDHGTNTLKYVLTKYNYSAGNALGTAGSFFTDESPEGILQTTIEYINQLSNNELKQEINAAVEQRKSAVQREADSGGASGDAGGGDAVSTDAAVSSAEADTATNPTDGQKEAGNYKKGHVKIDGFDVTIENPKGSERSGTDEGGQPWSVTMHNTYGYIRGTEGVDGDHIDVFLSDHLDDWNGMVYVVDQVKGDGSFDEHKVMYGFNDAQEASDAYLSNYTPGWKGLGTITGCTLDEFKKWIASSHRKTKPFADYKSVKTEEAQAAANVAASESASEEVTGNAGGAIAHETEPQQSSGKENQSAPYTITPTTYTNKKGKTTPMHLVTFGRELSKEEIRAGKELAKESRGWWDAKQGGFMMRSEEAAKALAEALGNEEAVQDAQPMSVDDLTAVTDQAQLQEVDAGITVEHQEKEAQPEAQYDYDREDEVYDQVLAGLREALANRKSGSIPNIKAIEKQIRDLRKRIKTIEDGMATAGEDTIGKAFAALADLNGRKKAYEQFLVDLRKKMADDERDDALAAHGVKLGDKVIYRDRECTIYDADANQVTLDVGMAPVLYEVTDWENVELPKSEPSPQQFIDDHFVIGGAGFEEPGRTGQSGEDGGATEEEPKQEEPKSKSKWVDDEDAAEFEALRQRLRKKLGGQLNMGLDPEAFAIGVKMSYLMLKHGARKFAEFARNMLEALGEEVRPYIKSFYNGARDLPEMAKYEKDFTPWDEVKAFDMENFDKEGTKDIFATAEHIAREEEVAREAKEANNKLKEQRNEQRKETEQQTAADTEVVVSEAEAAASKAESSVEAASTEQELNEVVATIDDHLDKVNDQLAVLGYYEASPVEKDYNEAYGYRRNAEKKAVKNVTQLFKTLVKALGIKDPVVYDAKGKKQKSVYANIAPVGGDVIMRINLDREQGIELYMNFSLSPVGDTDAARDRFDASPDSLQLTSIMYRVEQSNGKNRYLTSNDYFPTDVTVQQMLSGIRNIASKWLPAEDYVDMAIRIAEENAAKEKEKSPKKKKSKKKDVSSQEQTIPNLFSGLLDEDELNSNDNDTATTRPAENGSREDGQVGNVPADGDGVLDTDGSGRVDGGEPASVSDTSSPVADGEREGLPGRRSSGSATGGNDVAGEAAQPVPDGGRGVRDGASSDGGHDAGGTATTSGSVPSRAGAAPGGRGDIKQSSPKPAKFKRNYLYPDDASAIDNMTPQQRLSSNVEALEVLRNLLRDGREATPEEREILGRYRGWGGVDLGRAYSTDAMRRSFTDRWNQPTEHGKLLGRLADVIDELDPDGERGILSAINRAALTSYYTPTGIARVMNRFMELAGFKGGSMLDPSMGNGVFEGTMSKGVQQRTMIHGVELDWLTGQIARNLYPDANVLVTGYEEAGTADNAYDVVVSNIPFGDFSVTDKTWKHDSSPVRKAAQNKIHNYFAVKMLDNTRPGGLCVIMTSNAILDTKGNQIIREHLASNAEILGIVRLPDNTFKGAGTSVVTDVIFLRKYKDDADRANRRSDEAYIANIEKPFLSSEEMKLTNPTDGKTYNVAVNGYFTKNKGMMIGEAKAGGQYRADQFGLGSDMSSEDLAATMQKLIDKKIVGDRKGKLFDTHKTTREVHQAVSEAYKGDGAYISNGNIVEQDGKIGVVTSTKNKYGDVNRTFTELPSLNGKTADRVRAMFPVRQAMKELIACEIGGEKEAFLKELRQKLQKAYDDFVKKFGRMNDKSNDFLTEDIDGYTLRSLERMEKGKFVGLSDIFTKNVIKPMLDLTTAKTPHDAISLSLAEYGEINPSFMEDVLGSSWVEQCGETLFRTPFTDDVYETADAYLSGDVKTKLEQAQAAAKQDKSFERNVAALEAVQPADIPFADINIRMGARWVPADVYTDFMYAMFGIRKNSWKGNKSGVAYLPEADEYKINVASNELGGEADAWRTSRLSASEIFEAALKDKTRKIFDTIKDGGEEKKVLNKEATELANSKIQDLRTAFEDWLGQNPEREEMLMRLYNDKFNRTVLRKFDGSHLNIAGLMGKELRPHQKDAVWMLINNRGGIVDHIVGAGKTLVMQSAIMEMRRMGIAKKPMIIGLKATVAQIAKEFREAYPAARILAPTEKDFSKENRKKFMSQIALNDYDCVVLSHDQYCMLPHTEEVERMVIDEQMAQLDAAIEFLYGQNDKSQLTKKQIKGLEKRKANLEAKLAALLDRKIDREFTFEGLGVDYLFVDECQHFKSLPYVTTYDRVAGLGDKKGSQRAVALLNGVRYLQSMHQGDRGTVFLSGTTISNSLSEIYHLLNYLRPSEMERLGMTTFDAWAGNFAIHSSELEYGVTNELKEKDRFRMLTNIPELSKMYAEIADVRNDMNLKLPKPKMRSHVVTVPQTEVMQEINAQIIEMVKNKKGDYFDIQSNEKTPWGLLASTLSAKCAINPRLIDETLENEGGKIPAVCENVKKIYDQFHEQKGTQLIFCDTGVPSKGKTYDAYSDIIGRLVNDYGIPRNEIADIHEADTDEKRKALFAKVNDGTVRILIGGTKNMGTGVNVQKRIVAMHHVDVPWTPADREQREGRGVRQGNEIARDFNDDNVDVYFYATEGSLDMYKYQLQETKGKLFTQFKSGTVGDRTFDEGDAEGDFDPAEVVAMLSGNPVIFEKSKQDKLVEKLRRAKRAYESDWQRRRFRYEELQQKKSNFERLVSLNASDIRELERGGFVEGEDGKYPTTVTIGVVGDYSSRKTFDKPKEAGEYLHSLLKAGKKVELYGFGQRASVTRTITDAGLFSKPVAQMENYSGIKYTVEVSDDATAAGVTFRNLLQKVYSNKKVYERNLDDVNNQLVGADPGDNVFPKQAELDAALAKQKQLDAEYKKLSDEEEKPSGDGETLYSIREEEPPRNTGIGYKVFVLKDGKLYPPMVANPGGEATPVGIWLNADAAPVASVSKTGRQQVKAGGKGTQGGSGTLAYRPGWHLGEIPYALQFNRKNPETGQKELFPANFVWAEVEYAADVDYQDEAMSYGMNANGNFQHSLAGLPRVPENGAYRYRTNPNPETDPWIITGAMKVNRILQPSEVDQMVIAAGREPQPRQEGAVTDEQVNAINEAIRQAMQEDADMMNAAVEHLSKQFHTPIKVHRSPDEVTHPNADEQARRQSARGYFDPKTGEIGINLFNIRGVDEAVSVTCHETIAHKGLRELIGEERYNQFLDEVYKHLRDDLKQRVDAAAGRTFMDDATQNREKSRNYESHRRTATDELFGRMAEKPFEEFSEGERSLWQVIRHKIRRLLDRFLGSLKLPRWFTIGDNEIRYMLWRSKERLERGKEHPIDLARDIVKRQELGLDGDARYSMGDSPDTFKARQRRAVEQKGVVMPGLNSAVVKVVDDIPRHPYTGDIVDATQQAIDAAKAKYAPNGEPKTLHYDNHGAEFDYSISGNAIENVLSPKHQGKSINKGVHLALAEHLDRIIDESIEVEEHPDRIKINGERDNNKINPDALMHRFYGVARIDGTDYRVMTLMKEESREGESNGIHSYEVQKIEVLDDETPNTSNGVGTPNSELEAYPLAKVIKDVVKTMEPSKNLLEQSKLADEQPTLYSSGETDDIWNDQSMGLHERTTAAAARLASNHRDDKTLRDDAMRAIGGNLSDLRKAMSLQRKFDITTVKRVADLARILMNNGYLTGLSQQEVKRLLAAVKNSVGHNDVEGDVQKVMDIMVDNQLKNAENTLHQLEAIKSSKVDARGVEVQGQLDPSGQHVMKVFKKTRGWEKTDIEEALADAQQRMGSSDAAVADEAAHEYVGLQFALEYAENIKASQVEERRLRDDIKQTHDTTPERDRATEAYRQYIGMLKEAIRQNKIERAQSYFDLVGRLTDSLRGSIANAQAFKEAEKQRIRDIQHNANSDMEGRPSDEHYKPTFADKFVNNSFVSFIFAPLATFDQMLRMFGGKSANGEGYLYNRFMRGWVDARQKEIQGVRAKYAILDAKAAEIFGGKVKTWGDLIRRVGKLPKASVSFWNGGEMQEKKLSQGNLLYIYMVDKMLDGRMKLRKMGITEDDVANIEATLDPRLIELADWLQDEFLVSTRNEYNETHKRLFGASMAAIEHYFPLKILANARADKPEDLDNPDRSDGISTATGSIIKRRRNALALDITGADALSVILDHVAQMEHWNAYAELNRDLNTLRTYKRFRNQVQNMTTIYGSGKELWKKFNDVCQMAAGTYRPPRAKLDEAAVNFAKGVTAAKVSLRIFTALKQFLSMPAYIPEARADHLAASLLNPIGAWRWSMKHLPIFNERWSSRIAGDPRLMKSDMDWKMWRTRFMQLASRFGMSPNAFVDALTVSIGAHSMYKTRLGQYIRDGFSQEDAERKAIQDVEVLYNQTQQSSEGAFTSTMQVDRSWLSVLFTVFRNASMSYQRQLHDALRNIKHNLTPGWRAKSIEFDKKQYEREGLDEAQALRNAKRKHRRQLLKDTLRVATFGYIMQLAWNLGAYLPYLLFGNDDDEKQKLWDDVWAHTSFGWMEGLTGGDVMSQAGGMILGGEGNPAYLSKDMPLTSDVMNSLKKFGNGKHMDALNDMINLIVQSGIGVNPQSITDAVLAIFDACGDDPELAHEATICVMRILQVPQSQIDKMYFDEVGLSGDEVSKYTPAQLAARYAAFKVKRGRIIAPWSWDDEESIGKMESKAKKTIKERVENMGDRDVNAAYNEYEEVYKGVDKRVKAANKAAKTDYVEAARLMADAQRDEESFATYNAFKQLDVTLNKIVEYYMGAKSPEEAALCHRAILDYKSGMVNVLEAKDDASRREALGELGEVMKKFSTSYSSMQSNR